MVTNSNSVGGFKGITGKNVELNYGLFEVTIVKSAYITGKVLSIDYRIGCLDHTSRNTQAVCKVICASCRHKNMLFIYNPKAGKAQIKSNLLDIIDIFVKAGYEVTAYPTQGPGDAVRKVKQRRDESTQPFFHLFSVNDCK